MKKTTVLLVDDHVIVREGIHGLLALETDIEIVGEAMDGRQAVGMVMDLRPEVILMDIAMPGLNGLEATRQILKVLPETKIIMLTAHSDDAYVQSALDSGAAGFLLKQCTSGDASRAIRGVKRGKTHFSPSIAGRLKRLRAQATMANQSLAKVTVPLTTREMEVLQLIAEGKANKQTADDLHISIKTVEKHRGSLMNKLDIHDTAGLTRYAISAGVIESSVQVTTTIPPDDQAGPNSRVRPHGV